MSPLRAEVLDARRRLAEGQQRLKLRHRQGGSGVEIGAAASDLRDEILTNLVEAALGDFRRRESAARDLDVAFVAHGGYGRREVAPYSDVDLMLLCSRGALGAVSPLAERIVCDVFDTGLVLGHSVRTPQEACRLAMEDPQICTSLMESRLLCGSAALFDQFVDDFRRRLRRHRGKLLAAIERSRWEERVKFGDTVYLLEPNIKRSQGGLRDLQLLRWVGMARYATPRLDALAALGLLSQRDAQALGRALEFLLWLRNEMHFHANRPADVLDRAEQLRIADARGYEGTAGLLKVEQFMRDYFRHTAQVSTIVTRFVENARRPRPSRALLSGLLGRKIEGHFRVGPRYLQADRSARRRFRGNLAEILHVVELASLYEKPLSPETWEIVRQEAPSLPSELPPEAIDCFRSIVSRPPMLGELLRGLHEVGLLERFIPAFAHARGLLQFNQYHKYTVDEHCLLAVERAVEWRQDAGPLGRAYRAILRKHVLHLALLIHDLGKGYPDDHSEKGRQIADETSARLRLQPRDAEDLRFLVHRHLLLNHLALRRDISDEQLIVRFAVEVGSPELLEMLYVLTAADLAAVGPGSWSSWKNELIGEVYHRAMQQLAGESAESGPDEQLAARRERLRESLGPDAIDAWFVRHVDALPEGYLNSTPPAQIAADLRMLHLLPEGEAVVQAQYSRETETVEVTVATRESVTPGVFHKMTGGLTSLGLQILSAQINTLSDGLVLDRFRVIDPDYAGPPPDERLSQIRHTVRASLCAPTGQPPIFRHTWKLGVSPRPTAHAAQTRVQVDNTVSESLTVFDIFTVDQPGLLYAIARTFFELGLSVSRAKIGTFLDQVVDVFYVSDQDGNKICDPARLEAIRQRLLQVIESMQSEDRQTRSS